MKKINIGLIILASIVFGFGVNGLTAKADSSTININGQSFPRDLLLTTTCYKTKQSVTVNATYSKDLSGNHMYTRNITIPKGTVLGGHILPKHKLAHGKYGNEMFINAGGLNYEFFHRYAKKGYTYSSGSAYSYAWTSFQKIKTPKYMPTYSQGDLYCSSTHDINFNTIKQSIQITANGYVELFRLSDPINDDIYEVMDKRPFSQSKIIRTSINRNTRYLYLNSKIKTIKTTRVCKRGKYFYRLALKNLHQPQILVNNDEPSSTIYSLYSINGLKYFTQILSD